jgi:hypothetical protein
MPPSMHETRLDFLEKSKRKNGTVPIRRSFVQQGPQTRPEPGPLAALVTRHAKLDLDLYLLAVARAVAPVETQAHQSVDFSVVAHSQVWSRMLNGVPTSTISRSLARLENDHRLIVRRPSGRMVDVVIRCEDGSGDAYTRPSGKGDHRYLQLPFEYWLEGPGGKAWCEVLSLPAKTMLLIGLTLQPNFLLPVEKAEKWYGISGDTAQRGLSELHNHGVLESSYTTKPTPSATANGFTREYRHTLKAPFNKTARKSRLRIAS